MGSVKTVGTRMLKNNGSWIYCDDCNNTVAYLCYSHYDYFKYDYKCNCGNHGSIEVGSKEQTRYKPQLSELEVIRKRMRCPNDDSPLFSIVDKNIERFEYEVICKKCGHVYKEKI